MPITDHHLPGAVLPAPAIIVNPNQTGCAFRASTSRVPASCSRVVGDRAVAQSRRACDKASEPICRPRRSRRYRRRRRGSIRPIAFGSAGLARIRAVGANRVLALFAVAGRDARRDRLRSRFVEVAAQRRGPSRRYVDRHPLPAGGTDAEATALAQTLDRLNRERREVEATMQDEALPISSTSRVNRAPTSSPFACSAPSGIKVSSVIVASRSKDPSIARRSCSRVQATASCALGPVHRRVPYARCTDLVAKRAPA